MGVAAELPAENGSYAKGLQAREHEKRECRHSEPGANRAERDPGAGALCMRKIKAVWRMIENQGARRRFMLSKWGVWGTRKMQYTLPSGRIFLGLDLVLEETT